MYKKIPLWTITNDYIFLLNTDMVLGYEVFFASFDGVEDNKLRMDIDKLTALINNLEFDRKIYISFVTDITKNKDEIIDRHLKMHEKNKINKIFADFTVEKIADKVIRKNYIFICIEGIRNFKAKASMLGKIYSRMDQIADIIDKSIRDYFIENYNYAPIRLSGQEIWQKLFSFINKNIEHTSNIYPYICDLSMNSCAFEVPSIREQLFVNDVFDVDTKNELNQSVGYIYYNNMYYSTLFMDMLPIDRVPPGIGSSILSHLNFPLRVCVTIEMYNQSEASKLISSMRQTAMIFVFKNKVSIENENNLAKANNIEEIIKDAPSERLKFVKLGYHICTWDKNLNELQKKEQQIINIFSSYMRSAVFYADYKQKVKSWISSFGVFAPYANGMKWTSSLAAANMVPLRGPSAGTKDEPLILFSNRWNGITPISPVSRKQNKWSFVVIGPSGSGKSFFVNELISNIQSLNPVTAVIDLAPMTSYKNIVKIYNGEYIEVNPSIEKCDSINPFDFPIGNSMPSEGKMSFLISMLSYMLSNKQSPITIEEMDILVRAVKRTYTKILEIEPKVFPEDTYEYKRYRTFINCRDDMLEKAKRFARENKKDKRDKAFKLAVVSHRMAMPVLEDLAVVFAMDDAVNSTDFEKEISEKLRHRLNFYSDSIPKKLIGKPTTFDTTKDFIVINMGFLKDNETLLIPTYMSYREFLWQKMAVNLSEVPSQLIEIFGEEHFINMQKRFKFLITDEFHNFNANPEIIKIIDKDFRQGRTYGIAPGVITQALKDIFYEKEGEKITIYENAANRYFLRHVSEEGTGGAGDMISYVAEKTGMNEKTKKLFMSLVKRPGEYSEILFMGEDIGDIVLRLEALPIKKWLATTDKRERYIRDGVVNALVKLGFDENLSIITVAKHLSIKYPNGALNISEAEANSIYSKIFDIARAELEASKESTISILENI